MQGGLESLLPKLQGVTSLPTQVVEEMIPTTGIGSLPKQAEMLAQFGRDGDTYIVHVAEGETVVPMEVFESNPRLKAMVWQQLRDMNLDPEQYVVGNEFNSINPITGQPEFGLKRLFRKLSGLIKKAIPIVATVVGASIGGPWGAAAGAGIGTKITGGSTEDVLKAAALAGFTTWGINAAGAGAGAGRPSPAGVPSVPTIKTPSSITGGAGAGGFPAIPQISGADAISPYGPAAVSTAAGGALPAPTVASGVAGTPSTSGYTGTPGFAIDPYDLSYSTPPTPTSTVAPPSVLQDYQFTPSQKAAIARGKSGANLSGQGGTSGVQPPTTANTGWMQDTWIGDKFPKFADWYSGIPLGTKLPVAMSALAYMDAARREDDPPEDTAQDIDRRTSAGMDLLQQQPDRYGFNIENFVPSSANSALGNYTMPQPFLVGGGASDRTQQGVPPPGAAPPYNPYMYPALNSPYFIPGPQYQPRRRMPVVNAADGGEIIGPGTGVSDSIPAMLSDGEFVMTERAVKGAGNGSRRQGAARMYAMMQDFEGKQHA